MSKLLPSPAPAKSSAKLAALKSAAKSPYGLLHPAAWHALAVSARKPSADTRDDLAPGTYRVDATIRVTGTLTVGHDVETASTITPSLDALLATIMGKLNAATRNKVMAQILADAAANGGELPEAGEQATEAAGEFLAKLRRRVPQHRRGSVSGAFQVEPVKVEALAAPALAVVG